MDEHVVLDARVHSVYAWDASVSDRQVLLRCNGEFINAVFQAGSLDVVSLNVARQLTNESLVQVSGCLVSGTTSEALTLHVSKLAMLSKAKQPVNVVSDTASYGASGGKAPSLNSLIDQRLDNRILDARVTATAAIFKIFSGVHELAVEFLAQRRFYRIATPTLIKYMYPGEEDEHFSVPYFDTTAWLAPTGEVHLGMALAAGMERVYDIHNVFRREKNVDGRHLTEVGVS